MPDRRSRIAFTDHDRGVRRMRLALVFLLAALASCAPRDGAGACSVSVTRDVTFAGSGAEEIVTASATGASCDKTIALYTIHDSEGRPLWAWTSPTAQAFGDAFHTSDEEQVRAFVERWAVPHLATTAEAPPWDVLEPGQTTLDQLTYDDIRAREVPMLCHLSGVARESCVFWEPVAGAAGLLYERLATAAEEEADPS